MSVVQAVVLGIVQGLTEFLPISSSGHLILVPDLVGWTDLEDDPTLEKTFDVALHIGTFVGAAWYFRHDLARYIAASLRSLRSRSLADPDARMAWLLLLSAVPAAITGALFADFITEHLDEPVLIGVMLIVFGLVLYVADQLKGERPATTFGTRDSLLMGAAQALALQPGVSRSGVTMSMGRFLGFERGAAARISFLMSLPVIAGAGLFQAAQVAGDGGIPRDLVAPFVWGMVAAGVSGWLAIAGLLRFLQTRTFMPFVIYRVVVGVAVIVVFGTGLR